MRARVTLPAKLCLAKKERKTKSKRDLTTKHLKTDRADAWRLFPGRRIPRLPHAKLRGRQPRGRIPQTERHPEHGQKEAIQHPHGGNRQHPSPFRCHKRKPKIIFPRVLVHPRSLSQEAAVIDDEIGEISGEFGDNVSLSARGAGRRVSISPGEPDIPELAPPELPPDDDVSVSCCDRLKVVQGNHMKALLWKNALWMWRNVP